MKEACGCFVLELNTACVFHLMRAVEVVLKEMVLAMKAEKHLIVGKEKVSPDVCDWDTQIKALRSELNDLAIGKKTSAPIKANHAFYSEAINTFNEFKDAWRNTISHGHEVSNDKRKLYSPYATVS